jgi:hypothetical protein
MAFDPYQHVYPDYTFSNEEQIRNIVRILLNGETIFGIPNFKNKLIDHVNSIKDNTDFFAFPNKDFKDQKYYSSYTYGITKEQFLNKPMTWLTHCIEQSISFPFDSSKGMFTYPLHLVEFKFHKKKFPVVQFLISRSTSNDNIFTPIFFNDKKTSDLIVKYILINVFRMNDNAQILTTGLAIENNNRILYILDALNRIHAINPTITGYINLGDQCEYAMLYTAEYIDSSSVKIYSYDKITINLKYNIHNNYTYNISDISSVMFKQDIAEKIVEEVKRRVYDQTMDVFDQLTYRQAFKNFMKCPNNLTFILKNIEDEHDIITHTCTGRSPSIDYHKYAQKYLKYKHKYLKLKNKIKLLPPNLL